MSLKKGSQQKPWVSRSFWKKGKGVPSSQGNGVFVVSLLLGVGQDGC